MDELPNVFSDNGRKKEQQGNERLQSELYEKIGKLNVELDWLKKKSWIAQLIRNAAWWNWRTRKYPYTVSVSCWDYPGPASTINRQASLNTTCC